ncbi:MAG: 30S ribosomal protein S2 [Stygiobacter sp. RIFOXYC2_FULL_38_25]|nr:MAG: 30S ribosomal protein S2 [Stygiobacter sp. GWC2_38_9]OGV07556.1 MAG: 30S ribosomal protein S2 [Stygiobacter sp. RIFOXYB2_FULL_37_11]OGV10643.1 MAG: 30S ribosomal protein S2 [Stygiobacter sp. RIFOXYA2_FULL_38_8]OGV13817.1 MAG: 30S ribosomal protein S2 [Stygiobacter sp. RIFOXYC2_FULL_38_25]OGV80201.1 MAG: 30S ribosomal protein S2 [Stygiobacter sp. GWF2_38_21]
MPRVQLTELIESGAHFGHLTRRWNPKMKPFIFMEKNGIHIIDLKKTSEAIDAAAQAMTEVVSQGKRILFVGTKKQAKGIIAQEAKRSDSNWVSERWLGGMLTNFATIRKSIKRLQAIDKMESDGTFEKITKKERLLKSRERDKLRKLLDGVETMGKLPGALFVVDVKKESIAVNEAKRLNIPVFAIVDTNCDPDPIDYVIPANDDAARAVEIIGRVIADAVIEGSAKAKELKAHEVAEGEKVSKIEEEVDKKDGKGKVRRVKFEGRDDRRGGGDRRPRTDRKPFPRNDSKPAPAAQPEVKAEEKPSEPKSEN